MFIDSRSTRKACEENNHHKRIWIILSWTGLQEQNNQETGKQEIEKPLPIDDKGAPDIKIFNHSHSSNVETVQLFISRLLFSESSIVEQISWNIEQWRKSLVTIQIWWYESVVKIRLSGCKLGLHDSLLSTPRWNIASHNAKRWR